VGKYGEYNFSKDIVDHYDLFIKNAIANELAEANRLKRLVLSQKLDDRMTGIKDHQVRSIISNKDLEDQA